MGGKPPSEEDEGGPRKDHGSVGNYITRLRSHWSTSVGASHAPCRLGRSWRIGECIAVTLASLQYAALDYQGLVGGMATRWISFAPLLPVVLGCREFADGKLLSPRWRVAVGWKGVTVVAKLLVAHSLPRDQSVVPRAYRSLLASSEFGTVSACRWATFHSPSSRR